MADRKPYFIKSKAAKEKANYEVSTVSDLTSHDVFYTTDSNVTDRNYNYTNRREKDIDDNYTTDTYDSRFFEKYNSKYISDDSYSYGDYSTSVISYTEPKRKPRYLKSPNRSEYVHSRRESPKRDKNKHRFRSKENDYFSTDDRGEFIRSKYRRSPIKDISNNIANENYYRKIHRNTDYEEPEDKSDYQRYFEVKRSRERSPEKLKRNRLDDIGIRKRRQSSSHRKGKEYQVFAYHDPKQNEGLIGLINNNMPSSPEIENQEYSLFAFIDNHSSDRKSNKLFMPTFVIEKKFDTSAPITNSIKAKQQQGEIRVLTANLDNEHFIFQAFEDESYGKSTNARNSKYSFNQQPQMTARQHSPNTSSDLIFSGSLLKYAFNHANLNKMTKENSSKTAETHQRDTFKVNKDVLTYQVNVDIAASASNVFGKQRSKEEPVNIADQIAYKEIANDPFQDDYPVTKDYIKVNDNTLEQDRKSMINSQKSSGSEVYRKSTISKSLGIAAGLNRISTEKHSQGGNSTVPLQKSIIKNNSLPVSNKDMFPETSMGVVSTQGSIATANNTQAELTKEQSVARMSREESTGLNRISTEKHSQNSNSSFPPKKWIIKNDSIPVSNKDMFQETSTGVVSIQGSIATANNTRHDEELALKVSSAATRLSTLNQDLQLQSGETVRKSTAAEITKEQSVGRKSRVDSIAGYSQHPVIEDVTQASEATNRNSVFSQRTTNPNLLRAESKVQNTRGSAISTPLQKQISMTSKEKTSQIHSLAQGSQPLIIAEDKVPTIGEVTGHHQTIPRKFTKEESHRGDTKSYIIAHSIDRRTSDIMSEVVSGQGTVMGKTALNKDKDEESQQALKQFTKEVFQIDMDSNILEKHEKKGLQKENTEETPTVRVKGSIVPILHSDQTLEPGINKEVPKQSYANQSMGNFSRSQSKVVENNIEEHEKRDSATDLYHEETEVNDIGFEQEFMNGEKITSQVDFTFEEPPEHNLKPATVKESTSKKSLKRFASALGTFGRKKSQFIQKPYIETTNDDPAVTLQSVGKNQSNLQEKDDVHSLFVQSVEPTSTLYKKEHIERAGSGKSNKHQDQTKIKEEQLPVKPTKSKSEVKVPTVTGKKPKRGLSKLFSRSKSKLKDQESDGESGKSKLHKPWGILRQSKSKVDLEHASPTLVQQKEEPVATAPPTEGADNMKEEVTPKEENTYKPQQVEDKQCECLSEYVKQARECSYFFLGATLHQQVMSILNII